MINIYFFRLLDPQMSDPQMSGPQMLIRICLSANVGPQMLIRKCRVRKCRSAYVGPQVSIRKCRSASVGTPNNHVNKIKTQYHKSLLKIQQIKNRENKEI